MTRKLDGSFIQSGTITTTQLSSQVSQAIEAGGGPKVTSLIYPGNDTAANTVGGQTVYINGSGFETNNAIYINGNSVPSKSFISASNLSFTTPALAAGIYPVYVINTDTGATAIFVPGYIASGEPTWVTGSSLSEVSATEAWNISLSATGDAPITYALAAGSSLPSGISLAANGLISGTLSSPPESDTQYTFTVVASDAQNQDASRQFTITTSVGEGVLFANNVLLIHADGTNNKNNHTFLDSSNNNFTITRSNNVTQGSFSPFSQTGWSAYFDGTSDYLNVSANTAFDLGSGNFTVEMWVYPTIIPASRYIRFFQIGGDSNDLFLVQYDTSSNLMYFGMGNGGSSTQILNASYVLPANRWTHLAFVREGTSTNQVKFYANGTLVAQGTYAGGMAAGGSVWIGGINWASSTTYHFTGYISNVRLLKGTALYTSAFTSPSSQLTAISNTSLLTCQSNRFIDNSTNAFTVTPNGDASIQPFSPFAPTSSYSTSAVGGGAIFDGSGDFLSLASNEAFNMGTGDFTLETWYYHVGGGSATYPSIFSSTDWVTGGVGLRYNNGGSGKFAFFWNGVGDPWLNASSTTPAYQWNHVALTRSGNNFTLWVNGVSAATGTNSGSINFNYNTGGPRVGWGPWDGSNGYLRGILSNLRLTKGQALYTTTFTPPTAPFTTAANTSLLLNFTNAGIFDQTTKNILETVGDAKISTAQYKYGTGSMYFDGTDDRLIIPANPLLAFGTGPFTIEAWVNRSTSGSVTHFIDFRGSNNNGSNPVFYWQTNNYIYYTNDNTSGDNQIQSSNAITSSSGWVHLAIVRSETTLTVYVNGVASGSTTYSTNVLGGNPVTIGNRYNNSGAYNGYIDDLRISRFARYTSNFTAPTSALKDR